MDGQKDPKGYFAARSVVQRGIMMAGKYTPLETYLRGLPTDQNEVVLSFEQIEAILKSNLPSSAYEDERWWRREKEGNHVTLRAWASAGWKVESVDVPRKRARLVRVR